MTNTADAALIEACNAFHAADAELRAADYDDDELSDIQDWALEDVLDSPRATTLQGLKAKASVIGAVYNWPSFQDRDSDLMASLLLELGVIVPYSTTGGLQSVDAYLNACRGLPKLTRVID